MLQHLGIFISFLCLLFSGSINRAYAHSDAFLERLEEHEEIDAWDALPSKDRLELLGEAAEKLRDVPYIWGGSKVGSLEQCQACRECVAKKKVPLARRLQKCRPCQQCGLDCSHFVSRLFEIVGLDFPYASTRELRRASASALKRYHQLISIPVDLKAVQAGDLILYAKHVVLVLKGYGDGRADFIHASRFRKGDRNKLGGLELERGKFLHRMRGPVKRILRHIEFHEEPLPQS